ncbi:hypothetical protein CJD36_013695 [Flavipsychrobacter stenotrophus]|uniref:Uncharacterized protein n=1 Tax=Flavipsychrobacter stenotrophus TaxID=2077091 RepID=A0A2S7SWN2_9BACT|nr:hypothetical protein [Flavipsychrobacter stenotrophus]PQJ11017.1 hypothetical protein CJD36_013695 [Flavipsychrobacter stenotrophus]
MKLYPKELNSLKALEQEKRKLHKQLKELGEQEILSMEGIMGKGSKSSGETAADFDLMSTVLSFLPISNPLVGPAIKLAQKFIFRKKEAKEKKVIQNYVSAEPYHEPVGKKVKKVAKSVAFELITGYLKWKAIELTYKGVKHVIKTRKEKKEAAL